MPEPRPIRRRAFLRKGTLILAAAGLPWSQVALASGDEARQPRLRVGMLTDLHYADKPPRGTRHYRETIGKLKDAAIEFEKSKPDFIVELGDLVDSAETVEGELGYLKHIDQALQACCAKRHYVLGNHCVETLTKQEFLTTVGQERSYYSFDAEGWHFVLLDACFRADGEPYGRKNSVWTDANVPVAELDWLGKDLASTKNPTIVLIHQRLDVAGKHSVSNAAAVRAILEASGRVQVVFQGHSHHNALQTIGNIHYCTLAAMIEGTGAENNAFSMLEIHENGTIHVAGFVRQQDYEWS